MLLAFDTATAEVSVALVDGEDTLATWRSAAAMKHGESLAPGIAAVLAQAGSISRDVSAIAVGAGPGPFTGLRVGLVAARTMGFALEVPVYAVCSLDVIAAAVIDSAVIDSGGQDFWVATDARRKEVYLARYRDGARVEGPVVARPDEVATDDPVAGSGPRLYPEAFPQGIAPEHPDAAVLAQVVVQERFELLDPEPLYLRRPDTMPPRAPKRVS